MTKLSQQIKCHDQADILHVTADRMSWLNWHTSCHSRQNVMTKVTHFMSQQTECHGQTDTLHVTADRMSWPNWHTSCHSGMNVMTKQTHFMLQWDECHGQGDTLHVAVGWMSWPNWHTSCHSRHNIMAKLTHFMSQWDECHYQTDTLLQLLTGVLFISHLVARQVKTNSVHYLAQWLPYFLNYSGNISHIVIMSVTEIGVRIPRFLIGPGCWGD